MWEWLIYSHTVKVRVMVRLTMASDPWYPLI